ncbi:hypothetical protein V2G26_010748 [Clonostachys chloroleuca]
MKDKHDFYATISNYSNHFQTWGWRKYQNWTMHKLKFELHRYKPPKEVSEAMLTEHGIDIRPKAVSRCFLRWGWTRFVYMEGKTSNI